MGVGMGQGIVIARRWIMDGCIAVDSHYKPSRTSRKEYQLPAQGSDQAKREPPALSLPPPHGKIGRDY